MCRHWVYVATTGSVISGNASFKRRSVAMTTSARQSARPRSETTAGSVGSCFVLEEDREIRRSRGGTGGKSRPKPSLAGDRQGTATAAQAKIVRSERHDCNC